MKAFILDRYGKKAALRLGDASPTETSGRRHPRRSPCGRPQPPGFEDQGRRVQADPALPSALHPGPRRGRQGGRVGAKVRAFKPGDEIYARPRDGRVGTFAEFIAIHEADAALKPKNLSMEEAASIPLVGLTAWQVLVERAKLQKGQKVLIHAGSGGVGAFAIQLAKHLGASVATTTSTGNVALVSSLGADVVVDYKKDDFEKVLSGYDVVLNSLDAQTLEKSLDVLKPGGQLISISGPPDPRFAKEAGLNGGLQLVMGLLSRGIRGRPRRGAPAIPSCSCAPNGQQLGQITALIEAGIIKPVVDRIFPFKRSTKPWPTSSRDGPRARSSQGEVSARRYCTRRTWNPRAAIRAGRPSSPAMCRAPTATSSTPGLAISATRASAQASLRRLSRAS
jgi:NADPH:quinone reductase-like Zn-dependent oxidoreductase